MSTKALFDEGMIKVKENDHINSIKIFTEVITLENGNADALSQRAVAYLNIERYDLSLIDMNKAAEIDPLYSYRYASRAYLKTRIGDLEGAVADYEKAAELDPSDGINYNNLALAQEQLGYANKAKSNFKKSDDLTGVTATRIARQSKERDQEEVTNEVKPTQKSVVKETLTTKSGFKDFIRFIKNGFKIKQDD